jgi:hypothetical protein
MFVESFVFLNTFNYTCLHRAFGVIISDSYLKTNIPQ